MIALRKALLAGASAIALTVAAPAVAAPIEFNFTGAIQTGTIATTGTYRVTLGGAMGGSTPDDSGGVGGYVRGDIDLMAGDAFSVLVGGNAPNVSGGGGTGGGGLSLFKTATETAIAGGGGGADGFDGNGGGAGGVLNDGTGLGGYGSGDLFGGFGGGGLNGDGGGSGGGRAYVNGAAGGAGVGAGGPGGFGGGGGAFYGGGGGGGYTGGNEGYFAASTGGTSHLSGGFMNSMFTAGGATTGAFVTLELLPAAPSQIPLPGGLVLFGSALGGLMVMRRRKRAA